MLRTEAPALSTNATLLSAVCDVLVDVWATRGARLRAAGRDVRVDAANGSLAFVLDRPDHYVLRVRGDSMIEDQICDGDLVVIEGRHEARNGETVVALVDGDEATLKRFYKSGADVKLVPATSTMAPMEYHASQVEIRGVVRGLLRSF